MKAITSGVSLKYNSVIAIEEWASNLLTTAIGLLLYIRLIAKDRLQKLSVHDTFNDIDFTNKFHHIIPFIYYESIRKYTFEL